MTKTSQALTPPQPTNPPPLKQHFYKTAHVAKVKQALEQEYYLLSLSKPRPTVSVLPSLSKISTGESLV